MHSDDERDEDRVLESEFLREDLSDEDVEGIRQWQNMAKVWHDEVVPPWNPPRVGDSRPLFSVLNFQLWFPTLASTAALVMVTVMFVQNSGAMSSPAIQATPVYDDLPMLPKAQQAAMVESVIETTRDERQQDLQAALAVLKHHMDKRNLETEQSLQFVIANQLQGQKELEDLYDQVEELMDDASPEAQTEEVSQ